MRDKPAEKVLAVVGIYDALRTELGVGGPGEVESALTVALLDAATKIAMATDTKDMGIMGMEVPKADAQH